MRDNVSTLIDQYITRNRAIRDPRLSEDAADRNNASGNFQVSVRRQNDCMVAGGFVLVGDSAWMPKPLDAGGIGPALVAGTIVGKCVVEAIETGDVTEGGLWELQQGVHQRVRLQDGRTGDIPQADTDALQRAAKLRHEALPRKP